MKKIIKCAPSILASDFANISQGINLIESAGADWVHLDVMDGSFVPEITFGSQMVKAVKSKTDLPLDVHLMIEKPENHVQSFLKAGSDFITFHAEAVVHGHRVIQMIKDGGAGAGISIVPSTPVSVLSELLPFVDLVLIMTVNPGYGGQSLIPECLDKVRILNEIREEKGYKYEISIDGGVNRSTIKQSKEAGIDVFVAGSAFFGADDPAAEVEYLKNC
ncbi:MULTISPECIES: ribulose-phosphate 3-epimerase [unclassified Oceanispirochaeta]|uniref:ribulose-phosphate 3-epimerase n=1 Tax=unclassified Oceanispirochaeta TaxID=2635722 RepID=UPI000E0938F7|nr:MULTISPECIES: ribulose-phosphate 3-epimerase [unclassified Oceanispirochaeta]MBF9016069.1 ribulose-phosphate 3-epimerase [Oceanispirochaeta sp. M2]NPD72532.1 ribulose-phosphate 3-epimerase [Oceanispirochaeta sp. M1]RDG31989.1 ribulose-phosphate 3-epimerase [Oceanispirochaeta sp. M1]